MEEEEEIHLRAHRQHAIPQNIGAFQFKLIGQFTLKEFAYFGGFGFLAWLVLASKLFFPVKILIATFFATIGTALAFVPVAGRPLDKMILYFIKSITTPTQRVWVKKGGLPEFFKPSFGKPSITPTLTKTAASRRALEEYLYQFQPKPALVDIAETAFISKLDFATSLPAKVALAVKKAIKEQPRIEEITLKGLTKEERQPIREAIVPIASAVNFAERPVITLPSPGLGPVVLTPVGEVKVRKLRSIPNLTGGFFVRGEKKFEVSPELRERLGLEPVGEEVVKADTGERIEVEVKIKKPQQTVKSKEKNGPVQTQKTEEVIQTKTVKPPEVTTPSQPNLVAGIVKDSKGHLLEGVILIIKNENGAPVRALRTNLLGQFAISTPLPGGKFTITAEKEGYKFSIMEFEAKGAIIPPILVVGES